MKVIILIALVALASAMLKKETQPQAFPGLNPGRIVGGVEADRNEFPFIVDLRRGGSHYCAGSIISEEWVVTAAHCSQGLPSAYTLIAGDHNIDIVDGTEQTRQAVTIIRHPGYEIPSQYSNDIALMKVSPPFEFNDVVGPVILPELNFAPTDVATVIGWGVLSEGGLYPSVLMKVDVPYVDDIACNVSYSGGIASTMICYGEGGKGWCQGDSGGPIVCGADRVLCGIVSWGQGCAQPGYPGVYTETSWYTEWIRTATTPTAEDPSPVVDVTTCGGYIDASSAAINFNVGSSIPAGHRCVWTVKTLYDIMRIGIQESGLVAEDKIYVTEYPATGPGRQFELVNAGDDFTVVGGLYLITFIAGPSGGSNGFSIHYFSSGFDNGTPALSGFASLSTTTGNYSYPEEGGNYGNYENVVLIVDPTWTGNHTLTFSRIDVENDVRCSYDVVVVSDWTENKYTERARLCGRTLPSPFEVTGGLSLIVFTSDHSVTHTGFTFGWA